MPDMLECGLKETMQNILKIREGTVIAMHVTVFLAKSSGQPVTTREASQELKVSYAHLSKVLQRLGKAGIVRALRGPNGGYILNQPLSEIRLRDILEAEEGKIELNNCLLPSKRCSNGGCILGNLLESVHSQVLQHFEKRLSELCAE